MICQSCGKQIADGTAFCKYCGKPTARPDIKKCEFCGASIAVSSAIFCPKCGKKQTKQAGASDRSAFEPQVKESASGLEEPQKQKAFAQPGVQTPYAVAEKPQEHRSGSNAFYETQNNKTETGTRCKKCGAVLKQGATFCSSCGQSVSASKKLRRGIITAAVCAAALFLLTASVLILLDIIPLPGLKTVDSPASEATEETADESAEKAEPGKKMRPTQPAAMPAEEQQTSAEASDDTSEPLPETPAATSAPIVIEQSEAFAEEGIYTIFSAGDPQRVINLSGKTDISTDKDGTKVILWDATGSNMQKFRLSRNEGDPGKARLFVMSSSEGAGRVLHATDITRGANIVLGTPDGEDTDELWRIYYREGGACVIELSEDPSLVISVDTNSGTYGRLILTERDENNPYQEWIFTYVNNAADGTPQAAAELLLHNGEADPESFILELDDRNISYEELFVFSQTQTAYIRNGIYALSGGIFKKQEYRDYFGSKAWYTPMYEDNETVVRLFNKYQNANLSLITQYERDNGWRK